MVELKQLTNCLEYLSTLLNIHVRNHLSARPQSAKENIAEDDHKIIILQRTSRLIHSRKKRGGIERRDVMIVVNGEDTTQTVFGMVRPVQRQKDQAVLVLRDAVIHESSMVQLILCIHVAHKDLDYGSSIVRSPQQVL